MNAYHQLALFIALFGGFLAWGAYEAWKNRPRTTSDVLNIIFSPRFQAEQSRKMAENRARAEYLRHIQVRDNYTLAMNTQQKFNRPVRGMNLPWDAINEAARFKAMDEALQNSIFNTPDARLDGKDEKKL